MQRPRQRALAKLSLPILNQGDVSLSAQVQSERIGNPYEAQLEIGLLKWAEVAVFKGFKPNELIFVAKSGCFKKNHGCSQ